MRLNIEKFLALTALLATSGAVSLGCTSENVDTDTDSGTVEPGGDGSSSTTTDAGSDTASNSDGATTSDTGTAGSDGATISEAGSDGAGGSADAGDASIDAASDAANVDAQNDVSSDASDASIGTDASNDQGQDSGDDAASPCLGDTLAGDAGLESICDTLPWASTDCVDPDAGTEGSPFGVDLCWSYAAKARPGVVEALVNCLSNISVDHCSSAQNDAVQACVNDVLPRACPQGALAIDGGTWSCSDVLAACPPDDSGTGGVSLEQCNNGLNPLTDQGRLAVHDCFAGSSGDCATAFNTCVLGQ
jgi:hypothetical protein